MLKSLSTTWIQRKISELDDYGGNDKNNKNTAHLFVHLRDDSAA